MKVLYTSDLHGNVYLYQELFALALSSSAEIIILGGDLLPSFPPTRRYEDMVSKQRTFIDQFLKNFLKKMIGEISVRQVFLIPGNWDLGYSYLLLPKRNSRQCSWRFFR